MSGFLLSGCCCGGSPCVTHKDEFASYYNLLRYQLADTPGGSTPVEITGWDPGVSVSLDGDGSVTVDIAAPTAALEVGSLITSLGVGASAGVTVRRADSADSISLWWLGGTSWELRQGSTVLESIVHAAGAFKLVLKTPLHPTTDVEVWIGGSLVHTESAVAFVAPAELWHVGLIADGEATFSYLETTPCPKIIDCEPPGGCLATVGTEVPPVVPVVWSFSVPAIGDAIDNPDCNLWGDDDYILIRGESAVGYNYGGPQQWQQAIVAFDPAGSILDNGDPDINGPTCDWVAVIPDYNHRVFECSGQMPPAVPAGKLPVKWVSCAFGNDVDNHPTAAGTTGNTWLLGIQWRNVGTMLSPDMEFRVVLEMSSVVGTLADYIGAWVKYTAADVISGAFVLDHVSQSGCVMPATITVTAGGQDAIARRVLECWDTACTPPVPPQPGLEYFIWLTFEDEDGDFWDYPVCLGIDYNDTTGSWEWAGLSDGGDTHPTCGVLPSIEVKIHCVEPDEGESKQWVMDITSSLGTVRLLQVEDPEMGSIFEGTSDYMCSGQTWDVATLPLTVVDNSSPQFGSCNQSPCGALWLRGQATVGCNDSSYSQSDFYLNRASKGSPGSPPSEWTVPGVDPSSIYGSDVYLGTWPFGSGYTIYVWAVDGSTYSWKVSHSSGTNIAMSSGNITCVGGEFGLDYTSSPYDWFGLPGGDPFGVCPGLDDSANIDIVWS